MAVGMIQCYISQPPIRQTETVMIPIINPSLPPNISIPLNLSPSFSFPHQENPLSLIHKNPPSSLIPLFSHSTNPKRSNTHSLPPPPPPPFACLGG
uniref:Uncharacterized protein n=1 Tax=Cucumis melo TaxID=3656 RepID=A0A9I9D7U2_CUCME